MQSELDLMMAWESGELSAKDTVDLFASLVKSGMAWKLQGCYGRFASGLIKDGYITPDGDVLRYP